MPVYSYQALDTKGKIQNGQIEANDVTQMYSLLATRNLYCQKYHLVKEKNNRKKKAKNKDLSMWCRQMSSMIHAGMSISQSLDILRKKSPQKTTKAVCESLYEELQKGASLSEAMKHSSYSYPPLLIYLVQAGEVSGQLETVLMDMYHHFDSEHKTANKLTSAMMYPMVLLFVTVAIVIFLMTSVLPQFFEMFDGMDSLPWNTVFLINLSNSLTSHWYVYIIVVLGIIYGTKELLKVSEVRYRVDRLKIKIPLFGKLNKTIYTSRFARTFATLFRSGVPVIDSLGICSDVLNNAYYSAKFLEAIEAVKSGKTISSSIEAMDCFDPMLISMIYIGEQSGELDGVLVSISDYFDEESNVASERMVALAQPIMILILALIILFIMISIMVPIYNMYSGVL